MAAASGVLVGSRHTAESLWAALPGVPDLREKTRLGPWRRHDEFRPREAGGTGPTDESSAATRSRPRPARDAAGRLRRQADRLQGGRPADRRLAAGAGRAPRRAAADRRLRRVRGRPAPPAGGARPRRPRRRARGRRGSAGRSRAGRRSRCRSSPPSSPTRPPGYPEAAAGVAGSVELIGRLEHDEVAELLPGAEALVMPSTFPEAFGMVAVEAAACGALPVSAGHSGMLEVSRAARRGAARRRSRG